MDDLPSWIKLVITSRNVPEISSLFDFHKTIEIIDNYEDNTADIVQYVHDSLSQNNIGFQMLLTCPDLVERVVTYSQGVFLYAKTIVQSILSETFGIEQIGNFPPGLGGIYLANFNRFFQKETDFEGYKPLLEIILASFKPLTVEELVGFEDCSRYEIMNLLRKLVEFFPENEGTYSAFHTSLEDWLAGRTSHSHPFVVDIRKGHSKIANALLKEAEQGSPSEYARQYLLKHLYYAKRVDDMQRNLNDISLIEIRAAHNEVYELIEDFKQFHSQQKKHVGAIGLNSANQIWDNDRNIYESQVLSSNMNQDLRTDMIYDFLYKNASLIQFYGMVPGFVRQQAFNSGLIPLVFGEDALQMGKGMPFLLEYGTGSGFDPFPAIRREFNSHFSGISALAVGKEARMLVSASFDKHVRLYRIQTGECLKNLSFGQNVEALAISTLDASIAIAGDIDNYDIVIYDEKLEKINSRLKGHTGTVKMMMTSKNNRLVSCGKDGNIFVWNFKDNTKLFRKTMAGVINVCAISGNGKIVSLASSENHVEVWNIESNSLIFQFHHEKGEIGALFLTNEGKELVIGGGKDALTEVWDLSLKSMLYKVTGHGSITQCLFVDETGSIMISGGKDPYLKVWDFRSGECIKQLESHPRVTRRLAVSDDLSTVVTGGGWNSDNKIRLWDIIRGKCVPENPANHGSAFAIVHANQDYLLLVYKRAILRQNFNTGNWKIVKDNLHIIHVERLNQILLVACSNGEVFKYHLLLETWEKFFHHQYQIETMLPLHNGTVLVGDVLGNILITGSAETLKLDFQATHKIRKLFTLIDCFVVLDYENRFTCIDSNGIHLFDYVHAERITSNVFPSEDGLYFGDAAGNLNQFSLGERSLRHHVHAHPVPVTSILYLKNLNRLISGCEDGTIRIWRGDLSQSTEIKAYTTPVVSLISSDGPTFISVSGFQRSENDPAGSFQDLALKKWNVFTGECLGVLPLDDKIIALDRDEKGSIVCLQRNGHILKFSQYKGK
jgi:WD40 repeat protein